MILIYDSDELEKDRIRKFLVKNGIFNIVLANTEEAKYNLLIGASNLFHELEYQKGPIVLYGRCSDKDAEFLGKFNLFKRKDICHIKSIFTKNFKVLYFFLYFRSEQFFKKRIELYK